MVGIFVANLLAVVVKTFADILIAIIVDGLGRVQCIPSENRYFFIFAGNISVLI